MLLAPVFFTLLIVLVFFWRVIGLRLRVGYVVVLLFLTLISLPLASAIAVLFRGFPQPVVTVVCVVLAVVYALFLKAGGEGELQLSGAFVVPVLALLSPVVYWFFMGSFNCFIFAIFLACLILSVVAITFFRLGSETLKRSAASLAVLLALSLVLINFCTIFFVTPQPWPDWGIRVNFRALDQMETQWDFEKPSCFLNEASMASRDKEIKLALYGYYNQRNVQHYFKDYVNTLKSRGYEEADLNLSFKEDYLGIKDSATLVKGGELVRCELLRGSRILVVKTEKDEDELSALKKILKAGWKAYSFRVFYIEYGDREFLCGNEARLTNLLLELTPRNLERMDCNLTDKTFEELKANGRMLELRFKHSTDIMLGDQPVEVDGKYFVLEGLGLKDKVIIKGEKCRKTRYDIECSTNYTCWTIKEETLIDEIENLITKTITK
ncbi:MAG: hypothetical protein ACLFVX_03260 [Archaeoglobaceae archaeon]